MTNTTNAKLLGSQSDHNQEVASAPRLHTIMELGLRIGSEESFHLVQSFLQESGYTEAWLLKHFQVAGLHLLLYPFQLGEEFRGLYEGAGIMPLIARLMMGGLSATAEELDRHVPAPVQEALRALGLLTARSDDPSRFLCPALVYPAFGFFIATDRGIFLDGMPGYRGPDYVLSGTEQICRAYVESLPDTPCGTFLEIGTGSGLAALCASRTARHVWATDITRRAVGYAEFNRRLNRVSNMTVLQGDLFTPVEGLKFDRIACNPPFEPPLKRGHVFSVGGEDGEQIMRRVLEAAPAHLNPGGRLYMQVMGTNRESDDLDARIRRYLGNAAEECDLALFIRQRMEPREYAIEQLLGDNEDSWKLFEWNAFYKKLRALEVLYGHLVVQRAAKSRPVFHTVRRFGPRTSASQMEWLLDWETRTTDPAHREFLNGSRPAVSSGWSLDVRHVMRDGKLTPEAYTLKTDDPFEVEIAAQPWIAAMVASCDGKRTAAELLSMEPSHGALADEDGPAEFARVLDALIASNILRLNGVEPPA